jgi:coenzyme F420-reducing hydrogenase gamma subunit
MAVSAKTLADGETRTARKSLAVWKFASCDGCQLSLLDCEDELLLLAERLEISYFLEASSATAEGPFDVSLVEGSITTPHDAERIQDVRRKSRALITIGACATTGGIQALRNFADVAEFTSIVYASPDYISTLERSTPISAHVPVDFELNGCPIDKRQLLEVIAAHLAGRRPHVRPHSVCIECKRRGTVCVMVAHGTPCLGPVTHAGCGAICPAYDRGCYGCYGPMEAPNAPSLNAWMTKLGSSELDLVRVYRTFNANSQEFRRASEAHEHGGLAGGRDPAGDRDPGGDPAGEEGP